MKIRSLIISLLVILVLVVGTSYIIVSLRKSGAPPETSKTPSLAESPVRIYGRVEPLGREVFVAPVKAGRVTKVMVTEGQDVSIGMPLCEIESDVERQALQVAIARVEELKAKLDLLQDELQRKQKLLPDRAVSELEVSQKQLEARALQKQIITAEAEVELKRRELELLLLRSPITGRVYKFDVRLGEYLTPQDSQRIIIGKHLKQVRLFIEAFWLDKVSMGDSFDVYDAENLRFLGKGAITYIAEYTGARDFRTEDALERLDTKYIQAILELDRAVSTPLGSLVVCERVQTNKESSKKVDQSKLTSD